jgi:hypothetical protein
MREFEVLQKCDHRNIVKLLAIEEDVSICRVLPVPDGMNVPVLVFLLKRNSRARHPTSPGSTLVPFYPPGGALLFFLNNFFFLSFSFFKLVIMIPAPSGSHLNFLRCVKLMGKHFIDPKRSVIL